MYSYNWVLLSNKKEWAIESHNNTSESQKTNKAKRQTPETNEVYKLSGKNMFKEKLIYIDWKENSSCFWGRGRTELSKVTEMFYI